MKFTLFTIAAFVAGVSAQFTINTPTNVVVCQPILLSWSGGVAPYFLSILPGNQPGAAALEDLGTQAGTSFTWKADIAAGTLIGLNLRDSSGQTAQSAAFSINTGPDSSCVGQGQSSVVGASSVAGASTPVVGTTTTPVVVPTTTTPVVVSTTTTPAVVSTTTPAGSTNHSSSSKAGTSSAPATSSSANSAPGQAAQLGLAGAFGAAVIALLA